MSRHTLNTSASGATIDGTTDLEVKSLKFINGSKYVQLATISNWDEGKNDSLRMTTSNSTTTFEPRTQMALV